MRPLNLRYSVLLATIGEITYTAYKCGKGCALVKSGLYRMTVYRYKSLDQLSEDFVKRITCCARQNKGYSLVLTNAGHATVLADYKRRNG